MKRHDALSESPCRNVEIVTIPDEPRVGIESPPLGRRPGGLPRPHGPRPQKHREEKTEGAGLPLGLESLARAAEPVESRNDQEQGADLDKHLFRIEPVRRPILQLWIGEQPMNQEQGDRGVSEVMELAPQREFELLLKVGRHDDDGEQPERPGAKGVGERLVLRPDRHEQITPTEAGLRIQGDQEDVQQDEHGRRVAGPLVDLENGHPAREADPLFRPDKDAEEDVQGQRAERHQGRRTGDVKGGHAREVPHLALPRPSAAKRPPRGRSALPEPDRRGRGGSPRDRA